MPHRVQDSGDSEVHGVYANQHLMALLTNLIGRDVVVDTRDGLRFEGIFAACSPQFEVGLKYAHEIPLINGADDHQKLLPHKDDIIEKLQFEKDDIVYITAVMRDEKHIEGFATDREYADRSGPAADVEFQVWESEDGDFDDMTLLTSNPEDGWSVEQMFRANDILGVKSTFNAEMSEYTTAEVQGDAEDFKRAERIAQVINSSKDSRARAQLENDDEERDLDKETPEFQVQQNSKKTLATGRGGYSGNTRDRGGSNVSRGLSNGRRSEGMPNAGRGRGSYGSGGGSSRSFTNSSMVHGVRTSVTSGPVSRYAPAGVMERPSAQEVHVQFNQWSRRTEGSNSSSAFDYMRSGRRSEHVVGSTGNTSNTRVYEPRMTGHHEGQTSRAGAENKSLHHAGSPHGMGGISRQQASKHTERVRNLREFHENFSNAYQPPHSTHGIADDDQRAAGAQGSAPSVVSTRPINNAWNKGPPASIRAPASSSQGISNQHPDISSARDVETSCVSSSEQRPQQSLSRPRGPVQTAVTSAGRSATTTSAAETSVLVTESRPSRSAPAATAASEAASPPHVSCPADASAAADTESQAIPASAAVREVQQTQLSAAASSSSIAPIDPTPSAVAASDGAKAPVSGALSTTSDGKQFTWNPDAPSFTPRGFTLVSFRNAEQQQNLRSAVHNVRTPPTAPQPLMSNHLATPGQMQGLALASPQGLSVQNVPSIAHAGPPQMLPYAHANAYGTAMPVYYNTPVVQTAANAAAATATAAANVTGGPIVANTTGLPIARQGQIGGQTTSASRRNQQQQLVQSVTGMFVPGTGQQYAQPLMSQYQMPYFASYPPHLSVGASASMPPPPIPPPTTNAVLTAPPPYQIIQAQTQQPATGYPRHFYQSDQSMNYMVSRYPQPHTVLDYSAAVPTTVTSAVQITQQQPQQTSSAASSNSTGSNGHNSQPATPGPVTSPGQVQQQSSASHYPQSGTPQSPHTVLVQLPHGAAPPNPQPHMYVQASQFPFIAAGQPSYVMTYGPQPVVVHPSVAASAHVPFSQAHQTHGQPGAVEPYQGPVSDQAVLPQGQVGGALPHQAYVSSGSDQYYGQYVHAHPQQPIYQQQAGNAGSARHNSVNSGSSAPPPHQQPFQPAGVSQNNSVPPRA